MLDTGHLQDGEAGRKNIMYLSEVIGFCGIQEQEGVRYVYGTGCIEPQLTTLIKGRAWISLENF